MRSLLWNDSILLTSALVTRQHSDPYSSTDFMLLLWRGIFVFKLYCFDRWAGVWIIYLVPSQSNLITLRYLSWFVGRVCKLKCMSTISHQMCYNLSTSNMGWLLLCLFLMFYFSLAGRFKMYFLLLDKIKGFITFWTRHVKACKSTGNQCVSNEDVSNSQEHLRKDFCYL